jgi:predicted protein tyrosine phosphatase
MRLMVCPRTEVPRFKDAPVTHFVSLVDPGDDGKDLPVPKTTASRLILCFSDLDDIEMTLPRFKKYVPPKEKDVASLVEFGRQLSDMDEWGLLTQCEAGISRSTAAAITILTAAGYPPPLAFGLVRKVCPEMLPNRRILRLADSMLDTRGALHHMAENHRRKAFLRAGYEDPTNVLLREARAKAATPRTLLQRFIDALPSGWRNIVGSGARQRAVLQKKTSLAQPIPRSS